MKYRFHGSFVLLITIFLCQVSFGQEIQSQPPVIFIVHGTYDASADWTTIRESNVSFASEIKRGFGSDCEIIPFLWRTDVSHDARVAAAKNLALELDSKKYDGRRVFIVAHSHGGNVALESLRYSNRFVDMLFCLSTPHFYLAVKKDENEISIPIYCSPKTRAQVGKIVSFCADEDPVVDFYAGLRKGIDDQTAIECTADWRTLSGHPRLVDDGGPIQDLLEDWFSLTISRNLLTSRSLSAGDLNFVLPCEATSLNLHSITHSGRMGYIIGNCIHDGVGSKTESFLDSLVVKGDVGDGSPESRDSYGTWWNENIENFEHSGWLLTSISSVSSSQKNTNGDYWDHDRSNPDVFFQIQHEQSPHSYMSRARIDAKTTESQPNFHVPRGTSPQIKMFDLDVTRWEAIGVIDVEPSAKSIQTIEKAGIQVKTVWKKVHY